jgi:hypothetical protein
VGVLLVVVMVLQFAGSRHRGASRSHTVTCERE